MMSLSGIRLIVPSWPNWHVMLVEPRANHTLYLEFNDGRRGLFDMKPYLERGVFVRLKDPALFNEVWVHDCTICWPGEIDIAPETLYCRIEPFISGSEMRIDPRLPDYWILRIEAQPGHLLLLEFNDRSKGVFDIATLQEDGFYSLLRDPEVFSRVCVHSGMALWPDATSLSPGYLYKHCRPVADPAQSELPL